jgi:hypothetical protein
LDGLNRPVQIDQRQTGQNRISRTVRTGQVRQTRTARTVRTVKTARTGRTERFSNLVSPLIKYVYLCELDAHRTSKGNSSP